MLGQTWDASRRDTPVMVGVGYRAGVYDSARRAKMPKLGALSLE